MDLIGQLIGIVAEPVYSLAKKHINYVACVNKLIKKLEDELEELKSKKTDVLEFYEKCGKVSIPHFDWWLEEVTKCIDDVNQFLDQEKRIAGGNNSSFRQCCCFIPKHHRAGKEAETLTAMLRNKHKEAEEASFFNVGALPLPSPPPEMASSFFNVGALPLPLPPPEMAGLPLPLLPPEMALHPTAFSKEIDSREIDSIEIDSREILLEDIIEALKVKDMIGIYGMGGVGKTLLVNRLVGVVKSRNLFDKVGIATVSRNPNVKVIRDVIADRILGQPPSNSEEGKKDALHAELEKLKQQQEKVLLIFDDNWDILKLHEVAIPCPPNKDFKIVVTSRFRDVCVQMGAKRRFEVVLDDQEAWSLLRQISGDDYSEKLETGEGYKDVAEDMVNHFNGLPLPIEALARALIGEKLPYEVLGTGGCDQQSLLGDPNL